MYFVSRVLFLFTCSCLCYYSIDHSPSDLLLFILYYFYLLFSHPFVSHAVLWFQVFNFVGLIIVLFYLSFYPLKENIEYGFNLHPSPNTRSITIIIIVTILHTLLLLLLQLPLQQPIPLLYYHYYYYYYFCVSLILCVCV